MARQATLQRDLAAEAQRVGIDLPGLTDDGTLSLSDDCRVAFDPDSYPNGTVFFASGEYVTRKASVNSVVSRLSMALAGLSHLGGKSVINGGTDDGLVQVEIPIDLSACSDLMLRCWDVRGAHPRMALLVDYSMHAGAAIHTGTSLRIEGDLADEDPLDATMATRVKVAADGPSAPSQTVATPSRSVSPSRRVHAGPCAGSSADLSVMYCR